MKLKITNIIELHFSGNNQKLIYNDIRKFGFIKYFNLKSTKTIPILET